MSPFSTCYLAKNVFGLVSWTKLEWWNFVVKVYIWFDTMAQHMVTMKPRCLIMILGLLKDYWMVLWLSKKISTNIKVYCLTFVKLIIINHIINLFVIYFHVLCENQLLHNNSWFWKRKTFNFIELKKMWGILNYSIFM